VPPVATPPATRTTVIPPRIKGPESQPWNAPSRII
jgi:hypothetical protein